MNAKSGFVRNLTIAALFLAYAAGSVQNANAANIYWNVQTGKWEVAANWSPVRVPVGGNTGDLVYINNGGIADVGSGVQGAAFRIIVGNDGSGVLTVTNRLRFSDGCR